MIFSRTILALAVAGAPLTCAAPCFGSAPQISGAAATVPSVWRSQDVVNAIGVSTHIGYADTAYRDTARVIGALRYLGVNNVRDSVPTVPLNDPRLAPYDALFAAGFTMSMVSPASMVPPTGYASVMAVMRDNLDRVARKFPGQILAVEGLNEPDITLGDGHTFAYAGLTGPQAVAQFQIDLYDMVRHEPALATLPVVGFSLNSPPYNQTMYDAVYAANPAAMRAFDVASGGVYAGVWSPARTISRQIVQPFDVGHNVATGAFFFGPYEPALKGRPGIVKETGLTAAPNGIAALGVSDETVQAKVLPYTVLDTLKLGSAHSFVYELVDLLPDPTNTDVGDHFGLFDGDWNPKPAATVMRNILTRLRDDGPDATSFTPRRLNVTVRQFPIASPGAVPSGQFLATQKTDGSYRILVWYEPLLWNQQRNVENPVPGPVAITLSLSKLCGTTSIYDPLTDTTAAGPGGVSEIPVALPDHVVIVGCT